MSQITLDGLALPGDLQWTDEFDWSPVAQKLDYTLTGALLVQSAARQAGRPITLEGKHAWVERNMLLSLQTKAAVPDAVYTLVLADLRSFSVFFKEQGLHAEPIIPIDKPDGVYPYTMTLKLLTAA